MAGGASVALHPLPAARSRHTWGESRVDVLVDELPLILRGFWLTVQLVVVSGLGALVLGTLVAAARVGPVRILSRAALVYVTVFRSTPLLVVILLTYYGLPELGFTPPYFARITLALTLYTSAFVAEVLRSGVRSVPVGQAEAARAIGLPFADTMTRVVLPQAFRASAPPMASVFIALTKNTSLGVGFGIAEATYRMRGLIRDHPADVWVIFGGIALGYIIVVEMISGAAALLQRRWAVRGR
jgi:glutamate transport system permease protein